MAPSRAQLRPPAEQRPAVVQSWEQRSAELQTEASAASEAAEAAKAAAAKLRKDQENERERVKKVMGDMKKKMDRCLALEPCMCGLQGHSRSCTAVQSPSHQAIAVRAIVFRCRCRIRECQSYYTPMAPAP